VKCPLECSFLLSRHWYLWRLELQQLKLDIIDIAAAISQCAASLRVVNLFAVGLHVLSQHAVSLRVLTTAAHPAVARLRVFRPMIAAQLDPHAAPQHECIAAVNPHVVEQLSIAVHRLLHRGR
jgi:hypothetical protein